MQTLVAPAQSVSLPLSRIRGMVTVTVAIAPGESGSGVFAFSAPGLELAEHTVDEEEPWTLTFQNLGVVRPVVQNRGSTSLVFTLSDEV